MERALAQLIALKQQYNDPRILEALQRLSNDQGSQDIDEWAKKLYEAKRDRADPKSVSLNNDRKVILALVYDLVNLWNRVRDELGNQAAESFEDKILTIFEARRIERIMAFGVPMDRAQALYAMKLPTRKSYGMHWYCTYHFDNTSPYCNYDYSKDQTEEEQEAWRKVLLDYPGFPTMNKRLYQLLFSEKLGLRRRHPDQFGRWCKPQETEFVHVQEISTPSSDSPTTTTSTFSKEAQKLNPGPSHHLKVTGDESHVGAKEIFDGDSVTEPGSTFSEPNDISLTVFQVSPLVSVHGVNDFIMKPNIVAVLEEEIMREAVVNAQVNVDIDFVSATQDNILQFLVQDEGHMIHISCFGDSTHIALDDGSGELLPMLTRDLEDWIHAGGNNLEFVFISACDSRSAGETFVQMGARHVICCQGAIDQRILVGFTQAFYEAMGNGRLLDDAFQLARQFVASEPDFPTEGRHDAGNIVLLPDGENHHVPFSDDQPLARRPKYSFLSKLVPLPQGHPEGREMEVRKILAALKSPHIIHVVGPAGVGKVSLVQTACFHHGRYFPREHLVWLPVPYKHDNEDDDLGVILMRVLDMFNDGKGAEGLRNKEGHFAALLQQKTVVVIDAKGLNVPDKIPSIFLKDLALGVPMLRVILIREFKDSMPDRNRPLQQIDIQVESLDTTELVPIEGQPDTRWEERLLKERLDSYPLELTRNIQVEEFGDIRSRLNECFRVLSFQAQFFSDPVSVEVLTSDNVEIRLVLWIAKDRKEVVAEVRHIAGDSVLFQIYSTDILNAVVGRFEHTDFEDDEKSISYLRLLDEDSESELSEAALDKGAESELALNIVHGIFETDTPDSRRRGMEGVCTLANARKSVLSSALLMSRALLLGEFSTTRVGLHRNLLNTIRAGIDAEDKWMEEFTKCSDGFPAYKSEAMYLFNRALEALGFALENLTSFGFQSDTDSDPLLSAESVLERFVKSSEGAQMDIVDILLRTLDRARVRLHNAWLAARCLVFMCQGSRVVRAQVSEQKGVEIAKKAHHLGESHHAKLETQCHRLHLALEETDLQLDRVL